MMTFEEFKKKAKKLGYKDYFRYDVYTGWAMLYGITNNNNTFEQNGCVTLENVPYDKMLRIMEVLQ